MSKRTTEQDRIRENQHVANSKLRRKQREERLASWPKQGLTVIRGPWPSQDVEVKEKKKAVRISDKQYDKWLDDFNQKFWNQPTIKG